MKRYLYILSFLISLLLGFAEENFAQTCTVNPANGWLIPAGVSSITVYVYGAGGGSGGSISATGDNASGGGGGGACAIGTFAVVAGQACTITYGAGGTAGTTAGTNGGPGGTTTFQDAAAGVTISANGGGGGGGVAINGGAGTAGSGATTGAGYTTIYAGGNGTVGVRNASVEVGGAGGGGAGNGGAGGNGTAGTTGGANSIGGTGGIGAANNYPGGAGAGATNTGASLPGVAGNPPGGGAAGCANYTTAEPGAIGGAGQVVVCYTVVLNTITTSVAIPTPICAGSTFNVAYTIVGTYNAGNIFTAQLSDAAGAWGAPTVIGSVASTVAGNVSVTIPAGTATGAGYLIRIISSNPAITGSNSNVLTINALPVVAAIGGGSATACVGSTSPAFTDATAGGVWSTTSGTGSASISVGGVVTGTTVGTVTVNYTKTTSGCSTTVTTPITVNDVPGAAGVITGVSPVCPGQMGVAYSVGAVAGATSYNWAYSGSGEAISGNTAAVTINFSGAATSGNLTVRAANACGSGTASPVYPIVVSSTPAVPGTITGIVNQTPAAGGQTYSIAAVAGATTYTWTVPGGWTINAGQGTTTITVTTGGIGANGNITVTAGNACGTSAAQTLAVNVSTAAPNAGPDQYLCAATTNVTMAATAGAGTWTQVSGPNVPNIVNAALATTQIGTVTALITGTYVFRWTIAGVYDDVIVVRQ